MKKQFPLFIAGITLIVSFERCTNSNGNSSIEIEKELSNPDEKIFASYWYQRKAEITSYRLEQARYGEMHNGEAVLIFVTEDFSKTKQVKSDNPESAKNDAVNVLKMNMTKKFNTGIYPYSMMLSVFTPVQFNKYSSTLKTTASSQEWCGHTFTQLNLEEENYRAVLHSYFEKEGEQAITFPKVLLEDELWTTLRISPEKIPHGEMSMLPGFLSQRLLHTEMKVEKAIIKINISPDENVCDWLGKNIRLKMLSVQYPEQDRTLNIYYTEKFPYQIIGWEETYLDGFGANKKKLTTRAIKKKTLFIDYWNHNKKADTDFRDSLELSK